MDLKFNAITQECWDGLSPKGKWDIFVALRGPDCRGSDRIKWFTTSVIRGAMKDIIRVGGLINYYQPFVILPQGPMTEAPLDVSPSCLQWDYSHFFQHVEEASYQLGLGRVMIPAKDWIKIITLRGVSMGKLGNQIASIIEESYPKEAKILENIAKSGVV